MEVDTHIHKNDDRKYASFVSLKGYEKINHTRLPKTEITDSVSNDIDTPLEYDVMQLPDFQDSSTKTAVAASIPMKEEISESETSNNHTTVKLRRSRRIGFKKIKQESPFDNTQKSSKPFFNVHAQKMNCFLCGKAFPSKNRLAQHVHRVHKTHSKFKKSEIRTTARSRSAVFKCPICQTSTRSSTCLDIHLKNQHPESEEWKKRLQKHLDASEYPYLLPNLNGFLKYRCPVSSCKNIFSKIHKLALHFTETHRNLKDNITEPDLSGSSNKSVMIEVLQFKDEPTGNALSITQAEEQDFEIVLKFKTSLITFICPVVDCQQLFFSEEDLDEHSKLHGRFKCELCDVEKDYAVSLAEHVLTTHCQMKEEKEIAGPLLSSLNTNVAENEDKFIEGDHKNVATCTKCDYTFHLKKYAFIAHYVTSHLYLKQMEQGCPICKVQVSIKNEFHHFRYHHDINNITEDRVHKCPNGNCLAYFLTLKQLRFHLKRNHAINETTEKILTMPVQCKDCGKVLKNSRSLKEHQIRLHPENRIHCTVAGCRHTLESQAELQSHLKTHQKRGMNMQMCPKCGKILMGHRLLRQHLQAHERKAKIDSGELPKPAFVCDECGKIFKKKGLLEQHILVVHEGPDKWKFECNVCSKKCISPWALKEHMRVHTKDKPFVCEVCGQAYSHRHNLRIHVNSKHGDVIQLSSRKRDTSNDAPKKTGKGALSQSKNYRRTKRKKVLQRDLREIGSESDYEEAEEST